MDRSSSQSCEEHAFCDAVGVEVSETTHGLIEDIVQILYSMWPSIQFMPFSVEPWSAIL